MTGSISRRPLAAFLSAAPLVGLTPGPDNVLALATAGRAGRLPAVRGLAGRAAAFLVPTGLVAPGADRLLSGSRLAFAALKWGGVACLLRLARKTWSAPVEDGNARAVSGARKEFPTLMANPKACLPTTAFLPQVLGPGPVLPLAPALGALCVAMESLAALVWIGAGGLLRRGALSARGLRALNRTFGGLMGVAALLLARASRPV